MLKHIIFQAVLQISLLLYCLFYGHTFIPENLRDSSPIVQERIAGISGNHLKFFEIMWEEYDN